MISPTIGRVVWYWQHSGREASQPLAALIAWVHSDVYVNLAIFDANGKAANRTSVRLYQGEGLPPLGEYCEWMPYQIGQAAKHAEPVK